MRVSDPAPFARGLAVAAASLVGIPAACRWIEDSVTHAHTAYGNPAVLLIAVLILGIARKTAPVK
jgi:hypothetical protein